MSSYSALSCGLYSDWKMSDEQFLIHDKSALILADRCTACPWDKPALAAAPAFYPEIMLGL